MDEPEAHLTALLERIEDKFDLISEGYGTLKRGQDELTAKVEKIADDVAMLRIGYGLMKTDIGVLRSKVVRLEEDVHVIKTHVGPSGLSKKTSGVAKKTARRKSTPKKP